MMNCRGGYCFENNALLAKALASLGFDVYSVAAKNVPEDFDYSDPHAVRSAGGCFVWP